MPIGKLYVQYNDGAAIDTFILGSYMIEDDILWILSSTNPIFRNVIPMHRDMKISEVREVEGTVH